MPKGKFNSFVKEINRELGNAKDKKVQKAAKHMLKSLKRKLSKRGTSSPGDPPGRDTNSLRKGAAIKMVGKKADKSAIIGWTNPAQHAHLLELGTTERHTKDGKSTGKVDKRPSLVPTFLEEAGEVENILSGRWI